MPIFRSEIMVDDYSLFGRMKEIGWGMVVLIVMLACIGFMCLYSAANGSLEPWASRQIARFLFALGLLIVFALIDIRWIFRGAYPFYVITIILLILVDVFGHIGMGAQRWLDLGIIKLQPSELAKISTVMALARYFHGLEPGRARRLSALIVPALMILAPCGLVAAQPDLGTALSISFAGGAMLFVGGVSIWIFILLIAGGLAAIPIAWHFLHDYQRNRVLIFLDPESDPLGAGFHITQSKIALGSGGIFGKGFMEGTQSHLNFLPEKHTDFIFTLWAEEWGLVGGVGLIMLLGMIILYGTWISFHCRHTFGRLLAFGLTFNFSIYVMINIGMVMGLLPVVGIPLPLMSYGGTAMLTVMIAFGIIQCCNIYRDTRLPRAF
jgi:rod shape determining protein RodA